MRDNKADGAKRSSHKLVMSRRSLLSAASQPVAQIFRFY